MATLLSIRVKRALAARLRTISVESGYLTNTGENIGLQRHVDPAEITDGYFPMAAVFTGSVEKQQEGGRSMRLARRFIVEHWINAYDEVERAGDAVDEQAADILKAALAGGGNLSDDDGPIGRLLFESISKRDYPVMLAILLMVSATVVVANLVTDIVHRLIDPRIARQ